MNTAIILFGHGSRSAEYIEPFHRVRSSLLALAPEAKVYIGFLELSEPTFEAAIARAVAEGAQQLRVVPLFFAPGKHTRIDLPARAAAARLLYPHLDINLTATVGEAPEVIAAMARYALTAGDH